MNTKEENINWLIRKSTTEKNAAYECSIKFTNYKNIKTDIFACQYLDFLVNIILL